VAKEILECIPLTWKIPVCQYRRCLWSAWTSRWTECHLPFEVYTYRSVTFFMGFISDGTGKLLINMMSTPRVMGIRILHYPTNLCLHDTIVYVDVTVHERGSLFMSSQISSRHSQTSFPPGGKSGVGRMDDWESYQFEIPRQRLEPACSISYSGS
jgi:hypothetical protein